MRLGVDEQTDCMNWLIEHKQQLDGWSVKEVVKRIKKELGITLSGDQLRRLNRSSEKLSINFARTGVTMQGNTVNDGWTRDAVLAKNQREIIRYLNMIAKTANLAPPELSPTWEDDLTTIVSRRTPVIMPPASQNGRQMRLEEPVSNGVAH